jgi:metal-responsive CopG/Arc/MetJ family transcriptional regulator
MGVRTHVVLPEELVQALNKEVGKGKRNQFIEQAIREKLKRETLLSALKMTTGVLSAKEHPEWTTGEDVATWVRKSRILDDAGRRA